MTPLRQRLFQLLVTALALAAIGYVGAFFFGFGSLTEDLGAISWLVIGALSLTNVTAIAACVLALLPAAARTMPKSATNAMPSASSTFSGLMSL